MKNEEIQKTKQQDVKNGMGFCIDCKKYAFLVTGRCNSCWFKYITDYCHSEEFKKRGEK